MRAAPRPGLMKGPAWKEADRAWCLVPDEPTFCGAQHSDGEYGARVDAEGRHHGGPFRMDVAPKMRVQDVRRVIMVRCRQSAAVFHHSPAQPAEQGKRERSQARPGTPAAEQPPPRGS